MKKQTPTQRYRANMRRAGFRYVSFWIHVTDVATTRAVVDEIGLRRLAAEMVLSRGAVKP